MGAALLALTFPAWGKEYETLKFRAAHLNGMEVPLNVILPQGYSASTKRYPVLYLFHGYTVHYSSWVLHTRIAEYARPYQEIIVMPEAGENLKIPCRYQEVPGDHEWSVWDPELKKVLAVQAPVIGAQRTVKP